LHFFDICGTSHVDYCLTFFRVGLDPPLGEHEAEEFATIDSEGAFLGVESDVVCVQGFEDFGQICGVLLGVGGFYNDIVNVDLHRSSEEWLKDPIHKALVCCPGVFQAKGHNLIEKVGLFCDESSFKLVFISHGYLVVARIGIKETKYRVPCGPIDESVNVGEWIGVLRACFVEVCVVDAHAPLTVGFLHEHHIC